MCGVEPWAEGVGGAVAGVALVAVLAGLVVYRYIYATY